MTITIQQAVAAHNQGKHKEAEQLYREILRIKPDHLDANNNLGALLYGLDRLEEAEKSYKKTIELKPDFAEGHYNLAITLQKLNKLEEAEKNYKKAIEIKKDFDVAYNNLANIQKNLSRLEEAEKNYRKAIELKPDYAEAHNNLGITLQKLDKLEDSELSHKKAIELKPNFAEGHFNFGVLLQKLNKTNEAELIYKKVIELNPNFTKAHNNLGIMQAQLGKLNEAATSFKKAIELKKDYAEAHSNLGSALKDLGKLDEALESQRKALEHKMDFDVGHYNLGTTLYLSKQFKKAADEFMLSNYKDSKDNLLKCWFDLNDQSNFNNQLDKMLDNGTISPVVGSLVSRSRARYGIHKQNPFCNEPLDYVIKTDLTKLCDFKKIFIETSKNILKDNAIINKTQSLLINGTQTSGNLFSQKNDLVEKMKDIIDLEIKKYRENFKDSKEGFLKNWPKSYTLNGWFINMKSGGKLSPHMHERGWLSGSIYINVPPKKKTDSGNLVVCIDDKENDKNPKKSIDVVTGSFCLFPASLLHYTIPFEADEERIVLAFDVIPND